MKMMLSALVLSLFALTACNKRGENADQTAQTPPDATQAPADTSQMPPDQNTQVAQGEPGATGAMDDAGITAQVKTALMGDETTKASTINVDTRDGVVQLQGNVASQAERDRATDVARSVSGVKDVQNDLQVKANQ